MSVAGLKSSLPEKVIIDALLLLQQQVYFKEDDLFGNVLVCHRLALAVKPFVQGM